jgi:spermidine synthase
MSLATIEATRAIHARLNPGGLYLTNVISALRGPRSKLLHSVMKTLGEEFAHVQVVPGYEFLPRLVDNYVVIASDGEYSFAHEIALAREPHAELLVDERIEEYEDEFFLFDA